MAGIPLTKILTTEERQKQIRAAVRESETLGSIARLARPEDTTILTELLSDPGISGPIYLLPKMINESSVAGFIDQHLEERERGEGLLTITVDERGLVTAYHDIQFWPQWSACELSGAIRTDRQSSGQGGAGAKASFDWLFNEIGVDLICETAALTNVRTGRLLERIGFRYMGEVQSELPEGGTRPSRYWELDRASWDKQYH